MSSPVWRSLVQFRLRSLLAAITLLILAGNAFLVWWRTPFFIERRTTSSSWEHLQLLRALQRDAWVNQIRETRKAGNLQRAAALQAAPPGPPNIVFREKSRVYRNLSGEYIRHSPLEIFDQKGARLRIEHWVHGKLHGPWKDWLPDGREVCWGEYELGEKHGRWVALNWRNNTRTEEEYSRGVGRLLEHFDENGNLVRIKFDNLGSRLELTRWNPRQKPPALTLKEEFAKDAEGAQLVKYTGYWPNGAASFLGQMRNGLEVGEWAFWNEDGSQARRVAFEDGRLLDEHGQPSPPIMPPDAPNSPAGQRIAEALDDKCILRSCSLPKFEMYISDFHTIPVRTESRALNAAGIPSDITISAILPSGLTSRAALQIALRDAGLAPVIRRDVLLITTPEDAAHWRDETGLPEIMRWDTPLRESLQQTTSMRFFEMRR